MILIHHMVTCNVSNVISGMMHTSLKIATLKAYVFLPYPVTAVPVVFDTGCSVVDSHIDVAIWLGLLVGNAVC